MSKAKHGQAAVTDLLIAAGVFILLITIVIGTWEIYKFRLASRLDYDQMTLRSFHAMDSLIRTPGSPPDWETLSTLDQVQSVGLVDADRMINHNKLIKFMSTSEQELPTLKDLLNLGPYDFFIMLKDQEQARYSYGSKPVNEKAAVSLSRVVIYEDDIHILELVVYR